MKRILTKMCNRVWCLLLIASMVMGMSGCASLADYARNELEKQEQKEPGNENQVADSDNSTGTGEGKQEEVITDSVSSEDLMSDYFVEKMELLEYLIEVYYMNDVSVEDLRVGAYKGLFEGLGDPYSCYYTAEEFDALKESTSGVYCGIGAVVQQDVKTMLITIVKPYVDGPAYKAGMLPGDIIYKVNDVDVTGMEIDNVVAMMKGEAGTRVKVTVVRDGEADPVDLNITRAQITVQTVEYEMLDLNIGRIVVSSFDEPTAQQFKDAIEDLKSQGMQGLIIDLRDNGGGLLDAVVEMLDYILPKGMIVYTEDKYGNRDEYRGTDKDVLDMPMVVMINGNSASASEIFAAAMQDYKVATLVGTTSFGKGIVQSILPLSDGSAVKVTVSRYYTPNGVCIHGTGVIPDIEVELDESLLQKVVIEPEEDNQLQVAIAALISKIYKK